MKKYALLALLFVQSTFVFPQDYSKAIQKADFEGLHFRIADVFLN